MPTDNDPKSTPPVEPFRKQAVWGRPPQTTFRAGPLPRGERLPPLPEPPPARAEVATPKAAVPPQRPPQPMGTRPDIFSGSMIPRPTYKPTPPLPTQQQAQTDTAPVAMPLADTPPSAPAPDLTARALPAAPVKAPAPAAPLAAARTSTTAPFARPAEAKVAGVHSTPPLEAVSPFRPRVSSKPSRLPLIAGGSLAALAAVAIGVWFLNRAPVAPATPAASIPEAVPSASTTPIESPPAAALPEAATVADSTTVQASAAAPATATRRATPPAASRPGQTAAPAVTTPAPTPAPTAQTSPPVVIEIAPAQPVGPPPTTAAPPTSDPDAPVVTRPQPLD